jgi:dolichol kinase
LPFGEEKFHERAAAFLSRGFLFCLCFLSLYFCLCLSARARGIAVC